MLTSILLATRLARVVAHGDALEAGVTMLEHGHASENLFIMRNRQRVVCLYVPRIDFFGGARSGKLVPSCSTENRHDNRTVI